MGEGCETRMRTNADHRGEVASLQSDLLGPAAALENYEDAPHGPSRVGTHLRPGHPFPHIVRHVGRTSRGGRHRGGLDR